MLFPNITNDELSKFLRGAAVYFRKRPIDGDDMAYWANEANAERCEIAANRLNGQVGGEK